MTTMDDIRSVLQTILDPEMPINLVDLGIIEAIHIDREDAPKPLRVAVDVTPTFVGCPALHVIREQICDRVGDLPDVGEVEVRFVYDPAWSVDRITDAGREALRQFGVTVPRRGVPGGLPAHAALVPLTVSALADPAPVACPFCGSSQTHLDSPFGPTRCKMIYYCDACRNVFEHLKKL